MIRSSYEIGERLRVAALLSVHERLERQSAILHVQTTQMVPRGFFQWMGGVLLSLLVEDGLSTTRFRRDVSGSDHVRYQFADGFLRGAPCPAP